MNSLWKTIWNNKWYLLLIALAIGITIKGVKTYARYQQFLSQPIVTEQAVNFTVEPGDTIRHIASDFKKKGLIEEPTFLVVRARMRKMALSIKVGEYALQAGTTPDELLDQLVKGKVIQYSLTLIEGWTFKDAMAAINQHPEIRHTLIDHNPEQVMEALGKPGEHPEGRFFPDTYQFPKKTTDVDFLKRAYKHMDEFLKQAWEQRAKDIPLKTPYEALILASIIEKETAVDSEYRQVSGVFTRRLQKGMRLQTDPTVIYGLGSAYQGNIKRIHLRQDNPYNTYTRSGLPPTPIALPGADAIRAALNPAPGKTLYFVSKGDGSHHFSSTLKEHNEAVIRYQLKGDRSKAFSSRPNPDQ